MNVSRNADNVLRRRCRLGAGALLLVAVCLIPWTGRGESLLIETLQFGLIAFGVSPLVVCGLSPERPAGTNSAVAPAGRRANANAARADTAGPGTAGTGESRPRRQLRVAAPVALVLFVASTAAWRIPAAVNGIASHPILLLAEIPTLVVGTAALWMTVLGTPPWFAAKPRVLRIALAGASAWSVWIFAYVVGFTGHAFYRAYRTGAAPLTMQEMSVALLWAMSTASLAPTIFRNLSRWLTSEQVLAESETIVRRNGHRLWFGPDSGTAFPGNGHGR